MRDSGKTAFCIPYPASRILNLRRCFIADGNRKNQITGFKKYHGEKKGAAWAIFHAVVFFETCNLVFSIAVSNEPPP